MLLEQIVMEQRGKMRAQPCLICICNACHVKVFISDCGVRTADCRILTCLGAVNGRSDAISFDPLIARVLCNTNIESRVRTIRRPPNKCYRLQPRLIASIKISFGSPPVSHIENPGPAATDLRFRTYIYTIIGAPWYRATGPNSPTNTSPRITVFLLLIMN